MFFPRCRRHLIRDIHVTAQRITSLVGKRHFHRLVCALKTKQARLKGLRARGRECRTCLAKPERKERTIVEYRAWITNIRGNTPSRVNGIQGPVKPSCHDANTAKRSTTPQSRFSTAVTHCSNRIRVKSREGARRSKKQARKETNYRIQVTIVPIA